jgi:cysteine desulfurase
MNFNTESPRVGIQLPIYMDNHATTPVDPRVLAAMLPYFTEKFGNAASRSHSFGWEAEHAVDTACMQIAKLIGASSKEIVFTSGATESNNLALKGAAEAYRDRGNHIITQITEHKAVLDTCKRLEQQGSRVTYLPVNRDGRVDPEAVRRAITAETILVSIQFANNEIGVIQPVDAIGRMCRERGVLFHTDAVQAVGKVPVDVSAFPVDLLSLSAHKMYGPKGIGALYVRRNNPKIKLAAQIDGGGHQGGMRSGTLDVPGIVGLGMACEIACVEMAAESERISAMRNRLKERLESGLDGTQVNGTMEDRLPGNLNMSFFHTDGEALMMALDDVAVSSGSACTSAAIEPSYVLRALGIDDETAHSSIRFGLGRFNTMEEVEYVANRVIEAVRHLRELSPAAVDASTAP